MAVAVRKAEDRRSSRRVSVRTPSRPRLVVAAQRTRRWPAVLAAGFVLVVLGGLLAAAVFHTQLAARQIEISELESAVNEERDRFDELRHRRAELRAPVRLATEADRLGMVPGRTTTFVSIDPMMRARQLAAAGIIDDDTRQIIIDNDPLEQFSDVKRVSNGQP